MQNGQFVRCVIYLLVSAACLIAAAFINQQKSKALTEYEAARKNQSAKEAA